MLKEEFELYKNNLYEEYAKVLAENLLIPFHDALERSENQIEEILKEESSNKKNQGYNITVNDNFAGRMWVFVDYKRKNAFIYDIRIFSKYQNKGYAKNAIIELEDKLKQENIKTLGLNVFGNNKVAYNLYKSLGFQEKYISLMKGFQKQKFITLPKYLKFLQTLLQKLGYQVVAIEMKKKLK